MSRPGRSSMDNNSMQDKLENIKEWISEHTKIVMPAVLLICVLITVIVAVNANKKAAEEIEAQVKETAVQTEIEKIPEEMAEQQLPLEENAYPAVNTLMSNYHTALAEGDIDAVVSMNAFVDETEKIWVQEMSKYIESYPEIVVYSKKGPIENSYLVYVYSKVKFTEYDKLVPGMKAYYVCTDDSGNCYINDGEDNSVVKNYLRDVSLQDDVVELNNKVAVEYNELLESDEELSAFLADLSRRIDVAVGETLAKAETEAAEPEQTTEGAGEDGASEGTDETANAGENAADAGEGSEEQESEETEQTNTVKTVRATDVVNIRSSDSETADKIGKAQIGDEFTLLEEKGNGWSKITFEDGEAFIKSEFLETVAEEPAEENEEEATEETEETEESEEKDTSSELSDSTGETVTVLESVNVRKSANENGEKLGLVYIGEKLELIMKQADGWTKVKYKGETGYVKSEYVE